MVQTASQFHRATYVPPRPGDVIAGKYRVDNMLGAGGMSVVVGATHLNLDQRFAIKMLLPEMALREDFVERFLREGRALIRIQSEHVVRVLDVDILSSGVPFMVMEYLDGKDLEAHLAAAGPLRTREAVVMLLQAGEAIAEAHALGIVHRDLKPANLFLTRRADGSPHIKVLDFGLSKAEPERARESRITTTQAIMGTPHYMSPEQLVSTRDVDARADIWALGAILYELLAGTPPFQGVTIPEVCANILKEPPYPLRLAREGVPRGLEAVILRCLTKDLPWRYDNVGKLALALARFGGEAARGSVSRIVGTVRAAGMSLVDDAKRVAPKPNTLHRGRPRAAIACAVVVGMLVGFLGAALYIQKYARDPVNPEQTHAPAVPIRGPAAPSQ